MKKRREYLLQKDMRTNHKKLIDRGEADGKKEPVGEKHEVKNCSSWVPVRSKMHWLDNMRDHKLM